MNCAERFTKKKKKETESRSASIIQKQSEGFNTASLQKSSDFAQTLCLFLWLQPNIN